MNGEVRVVEDVASAFAAEVAEAFADRKDQDNFTIAFSGGSTATAAYEALSKVSLNWSMVTAVWGDDRLVPLDHDDSNFRLVKEALFDRVEPLAAVYPMKAEHGAEAYEEIVRSLSPLDVVHLGMGDDGHTASLFPGVHDALEAPPERLVIETGDDLHPHRRMTLTFSAIAQSRLAVFTVAGANKRSMFARIRAGEHLPAGRISAQRVLWLVDEAAAG